LVTFILFSSNKICSKSFEVTETMKAPVFLYYELENFYMNHRKFVKSKVWKQLKGEIHIVNIELNLFRIKPIIILIVKMLFMYLIFLKMTQQNILLIPENL
jgi:hypothetical protein